MDWTINKYKEIMKILLKLILIKMDEFSILGSNFILSFVDLDSVIINKFINRIDIHNTEISLNDIELLNDYLSRVLDDLRNIKKMDEKIQYRFINSLNNKIQYRIQFYDKKLFISMGFIYNRKNYQDIVYIKELITLLNMKKDKRHIQNAISLQINDNIINMDRDNIRIEEFKNILKVFLDKGFKVKDNKGTNDYIFGITNGRGSYYIEPSPNNINFILIGSKIEYNMLEEINISKLIYIIQSLKNIIENINTENSTILPEINEYCDSVEDPLTYEEWDLIPNKYKILKGEYPDLSQCYELTSLLRSFESNLNTHIFDVPNPIYPFDPYTRIPISTNTLYSLINIYMLYNDDFKEKYPALSHLKNMSYLLNNYEDIIKNPILFQN